MKGMVEARSRRQQPARDISESPSAVSESARQRSIPELFEADRIALISIQEDAVAGICREDGPQIEERVQLFALQIRHVVQTERQGEARETVGAFEFSRVHDLPLQFASETGIVGVGLWIGAMAAALLGAWRALARLEGDERAAALALGIVVPAFLVHGLLDYDWDFVALCGPLFFVIGFLLAVGRAPIRVGREYAWLAAVVLVAWAALYSITAPWVARTVPTVAPFP